MSQNDDPRDDLPAPADEFVYDSSDAQRTPRDGGCSPRAWASRA